jgi:hypothetical protein
LPSALLYSWFISKIFFSFMFGLKCITA